MTAEIVESASAVASNAVLVLVLVGKHVAYPFKVETNIRALEYALSKLVAIEKDVLKMRANTNYDENFLASTLEDWLGKVNTVKTEVDDISKRYEQRHRHTHLFRSDYKISRSAVKKLSGVNSLSDDQMIQNFINQAQVTPPAAPSPPSSGLEFRYGRKNGTNIEFRYGRKNAKKDCRE